MSEWQPIHTAPTDGTVVILYGDSLIAAGWYDPHGNYGWCFLDDPEVQFDDDKDYIVPNAWLKKSGPSHWMPLPEAPK